MCTRQKLTRKENWSVWRDPGLPIALLLESRVPLAILLGNRLQVCVDCMPSLSTYDQNVEFFSLNLFSKRAIFCPEVGQKEFFFFPSLFHVRTCYNSVFHFFFLCSLSSILKCCSKYVCFGVMSCFVYYIGINSCMFLLYIRNTQVKFLHCGVPKKKNTENKDSKMQTTEITGIK